MVVARPFVPIRLCRVCAVFVFALCVVAGCRRKPAEAHFRLDNGLRVDLIATSSGDKAGLVVLFDIGADHDPAGRSGMAHLVEHLFATSGGADKPARPIEKAKQRYGHGLHTRTGADYTLYGVEISADRISEEIDDASFRMSRLQPTEADLERERARLLDEIATLQERDPTAAAMTRAAEALRPTRGGGLRGGVGKEVEKITLADVEAYRHAHYGAPTARLIVAGHFDVEQISKQIKASFAIAPAGKMPPAREPAASRVTGTLVMGDAPTAAALAVPIPEPKEPLYLPFLVLAERVTRPGDSQRAWKGDFAPLARPDVLLVAAPLPPGPSAQAEAFAARMRADVTTLVAAPLAGDEVDHMLEKYGAALGIAPPRADSVAAAPFETAFAAGRRAQLGIDGGALGRAAPSITGEQVVAAAKLFDPQSSAAVVTGGKI
jgi:zinc protease